MKIEFSDKSYILIEKYNDNKIAISIGASNQATPPVLTINTVHLSNDEFKKIISDYI